MLYEVITPGDKDIAVDHEKYYSRGDMPMGEKTLSFISAPMLHWPDSMFTYMDKENVLFSNDAFGHHLASDLMYNDLVDQNELMNECIKYYANILTPFSKLVTKKINEVVGLGLPVDFIFPSHGIMWRDNPSYNFV